VAQILLQSDSVRVELNAADPRESTVRNRRGTSTLVQGSALGLVLILALLSAACSTTQPVKEPADDASITTRVKAKLATDGDINPFNINVDTHEGVVTIEGRVKKAETRAKVERYVRETGGVKGVINLVKVGDNR
jgi:hyperosmotically inducible protein